MKKLKYPSAAVAKLWRKNFINDAAKFVRSTNLVPEDFERIFTDSHGKEWKILGSMDGRDLPCQLLESGEVFIWDRWKVSLLIYPEKHEKFQKKVETMFPTVKKKRVKAEPKVVEESLEIEEEEEKEEKPFEKQLDLFSEEEYD
jgi:hypothetical protein